MNRNEKDGVKSLETRLAELNLSDQSNIRESLGRELAQRVTASSYELNSTTQKSRRWNMFRKPIPAFGLGIIVALAVLAFANPDTRAALNEFLKIFQVGDNTFVNQPGTLHGAEIDSILAGTDQKLEKGESYFLHNDYGGFGGIVPEGTDPFVKQVASLSLTAGLVDFPLLVPTYFHERIPTRFRFQKAEVFPNGSVIIYCGIGPYETMLMQTPVGEGRSMSFGETTSTMTSDGTVTSTGVAPNMEELEIAGKKVTWMIHSEGMRRRLGRWAEKKTDTIIGRFIWEENGMSYLLDGRLLTKEEGLKIIESLKSISGRN